MAGFRALLIAAALFMAAFALVEANFNKTMVISWGADRARMNGDNLDLVLNRVGGSGARSKSAYLFGSIEMLIKLVPGNSAGTVTAYYLSSSGTAHDEIDFEFLGNVSGEPYTIHTNIYTQGKGNREQQFRPWFDPTSGFHNYTIHWNPSTVVWFVDGTPIRVFRNYQSRRVPFPNRQGMKIFTSLWNADDWATQGGRVKTDWTQAPFVANFRRFRPKACKWRGSASISQCAAPTQSNWWTSRAYGQLSRSQRARMQQIRNNFMIYDYCKDTNRFKGVMPRECSFAQF